MDTFIKVVESCVFWLEEQNIKPRSAKGNALSLIRQTITLLKKERNKEVVAYLVECPNKQCYVEPSLEFHWPPKPKKPPVGVDWKYGEYECGICGSTADEMIITPLKKYD